MGDRLAHRKERLVGIQRAPEEHRKQVAGALRPVLEGILQLGKTGLVVLLELAHPQVRAPERLAMGREYQDIGREARDSGRSTRGKGAAGCPPGRSTMTLTLVEIVESSMSPAITTFSSSQYKRQVLAAHARGR